MRRRVSKRRCGGGALVYCHSRFFTDCGDMAQPKLTYFDIPGRGELSRLAFIAGGVKFEDFRLEVSEDDFGDSPLKPTLPLGQVPVLDVDGGTYPQSMAIARYAAKVGGLYPDNPVQALKLDAILETISDLRNLVCDIRWGINDEATKAIKTKKYLHDLLPKSLTYIEKSLQGVFLFGDKLSLADLAIYDIEKNSIKAAFPDFDTSKYPKIVALIAAVKANERIAAYLATL